MWTRQSLQEDGEDRGGVGGGGGGRKGGDGGSAQTLDLLSERFHEPAGSSGRSVKGVGDWSGPACGLGDVGGGPVGVEAKEERR